jgi:hypothetical protein
MTPFEKEYKERFKDARSLEGVEPDAIWDNIANVLPEEDNDKTIVWLRKRYGLWGILLLVAVGTGCFMWWSNASENATAFEMVNQNLEQVLTLNKSEEHSMLTISDDSMVTHSATALETFEPESLINNTISITKNNILPGREEGPVISDGVVRSNNQPQKTNANLRLNNNINTITERNEGLTKASLIRSVSDSVFANAEQKNANNPTYVNAISGSTNADANTTVTNDANTTVTNMEVVENNPSTKLTNTSTIQGVWLPMLYQQLFPLTSYENVQLVKALTIPQGNKGRNRKLQLALTTGIIARSDRHTNTDLGNALSKAGSMAAGQSLSLQIQWQFAKQRYLTTGLEWLHTQTRFDYITQWDTLAVVQGYETFGEIDAIATRTVRQHNQQTIFTLPLLIGTAKNFGALKLGLDAGLGLNYIHQQKGKTLNDEQVIVAYDSKNNNTLPYADFYLSYQIEPYLSYSLNERFALRLKPTLRYQQYGTSKLYEQKTSSLLWGLSTGVVLGF